MEDTELVGDNNCSESLGKSDVHARNVHTVFNCSCYWNIFEVTLKQKSSRVRLQKQKKNKTLIIRFCKEQLGALHSTVATRLSVKRAKDKR